MKVQRDSVRHLDGRKRKMIVTRLQQRDKMSERKETAADDNEQVTFVHTMTISVDNDMSLGYYMASKWSNNTAMQHSLFTISSGMLETTANAYISHNTAL